MHDSIGKTFKDNVTGFTGVATGRIEYITGCNQLCLSPKVTDPSKATEPAWFDEQRLEEQGLPKITLDNGKSPGFGDLPPGSRRG